MNFLFGFRGRIRRTGFVLFVVTALALTVVVGLPLMALSYLANATFRASSGHDATPPTTFDLSAPDPVVLGVWAALALAGLFLVWIKLAVATKRLHDAGGSAWWLLTALVPGLNLLLFLALCLWPGTRGENRFGPSPRGLRIAA